MRRIVRVLCNGIGSWMKHSEHATWIRDSTGENELHHLQSIQAAELMTPITLCMAVALTLSKTFLFEVGGRQEFCPAASCSVAESPRKPVEDIIGFTRMVGMREQ